MNSGIFHVVDFKTEQIVSAIQSNDYWDDKRHWEIKNNIDILEFKVFDNTDHAATLMQQNLVLKEVRDGRIVPYVITEAEKDSNDRSVTIYASGEWILLAKAGIIKPQRIESKTVNEFMDMALAGTKWKRGKTEYTGFHTMTIDQFIDPLKFLKDIASLFDLEIQYRAEVVGSQIVGRYVDMIKKRGRDTGKEVTLGKDLVGVKRIENSQNICTALVGCVKGEGDEVITIEPINNGLPYVVDNDAFQRWSENGQHKFGFYTPETENTDMTPERLMTLMKTELAKRINTSVTYEVEAQDIGRVFGLVHELINEGDTIRIKDTGFTPKLYLEARAIAGDESFTNPIQDKYIFGDYREITDQNEELRKLYNKILAILGDKANKELLEQLEKLAEEAKEQSEQAVKESQVAKDLSEKVQENIRNFQTTIIESEAPPETGLEPGKTLWRDISQGKPGVLKIWTGMEWDPIVPNVESIKGDVQKAVEEELSTLQETINSKVDKTWVDEQIKDKADKSGVFTKDEIKDGFVGKQTYETDKEGNIKKFEEINTTFEQTNEAISSKAEKQSITDLGNNLSEISKTANEAKQTAEGNSRTISEVSSKVSNVEKTTDEFTKKTTQIEETVDGITEKVTKVENTQNSFEQRVTTVEKTASEIKSTVTGITEVQDEQGQQIKEQESQLKQGLDQISSKVSSKEMKDYVGGLGSQNLILNSQFVNRTINEKGIVTQEIPSLREWNKLGNTETAANSMKRLDGDNTLFINCYDKQSSSYYGAEQSVPVKGGESLVASIECFTTNKDGIDYGVMLEIQFWNGSNYISFTMKELSITNDMWRKTELPFAVPSGCNKVIYKVYVRKNGMVWIAHPMLQAGSQSSSFMPAPKDLFDYNDTINKIADKISTEQFNKVTTNMQTSIDQTNERLKFTVNKTEVYTIEESNGKFATQAYVKSMEAKIDLNAENILLSVKKGEVISSINQSAERIKIAAELIDLVGKVEASWIKAGLLQGTTIKTSNTNEHIYMQNQVLKFVNQGHAKIVIGFEDERQSKTFNPYIILGEGDGTGRNFGSIYKDGNGVYYRFVDSNGAESSVRLTAMGNVGITAQNDMYHTAKNIFLDGKTIVTINNNGKNVASFKAANGGGDCDIYLGSHTIRSSTVSGYDQLLQIKNLMGNGFKGIEVAEVTAHGGIRSDTNLWAEKDSYAMQHINRSTEKIKTSVHDLPFSALDKIRGLKVKQYFLKRDMYELYQMRMNRPEDRLAPYTTEDIEVQYGLIAEETDEIFTTKEKDGIKLYPTISILTAGVQELEVKQDEKIKALEEKHEEEIKRIEEKHNAEMNVMNQRVETLEALFQKLINEKTEQ
ncbi:peptidase S74 [Bacillus pseudomycoides]|uniref:Peptidase S74 n=1 Tax=Bacillus pseudomycoides TaxID=64104 RepID=A0AA91ZW07_9BACI|nr:MULTISPECIES: phage tail spike protein [Bacillus]PED84293.1 peptidase S74 [Bacillus pseudomycoides]PEU15820.1 peptidase S74 [Bacillus sp. AFS019443]PEU19744.1 peptidase S74 [Bacillus sp. AFS014408]PFW64880.1 peptidase S74 [Bacillus sp. AFS075034]